MLANELVPLKYHVRVSCDTILLESYSAIWIKYQKLLTSSDLVIFLFGNYAEKIIRPAPNIYAQRWVNENKDKSHVEWKKPNILTIYILFLFSYPPKVPSPFLRLSTSFSRLLTWMVNHSFFAWMHWKRSLSPLRWRRV